MTVNHTTEDPLPVTEFLSKWIASLDLDSIPLFVRERAKHLILDGIGCGLVGARAPWSRTATQSIHEYEPSGYCRIIGEKQKHGPLAAALANGAFIQAMELDDYHSQAPLHSASIVLPALFAAVEAQKHRSGYDPVAVSGATFLLAAIAGFETGPRVGKAMYGSDLLSRGWHSGPVFGSPASAAATGKLFGLDATGIESAMGIACTQAGGLMSAQYEGMVKRMQHAFAARNGLQAGLLARSGYLGMKKVLERPYGGFLAMFSAGNERTPGYQVEEVVKGLGKEWETEVIRFKLYACVGGCHGQIEVLQRMQEQYPERFAREKLGEVESITVYLSAPIYAHDGWPPQRPITATGAQMSAAYIGAVQLVDRQVLPAQFEEGALDREEVWALARKTTCLHSAEFDQPDHICGARVVVRFADGWEVEEATPFPKGYDPPLDNADIRDKFRRLAGSVVDVKTVAAIEQKVLQLEGVEDVEELLSLLGGA
ncbi:MmgE/PrpD family protein [Aspergillus ibericus CBS 121593]|uniref:2-methylcitrate dehydratase PrpD n=1 Tax=Aspergillus ibericus CBS 121593 TaxID=1448316 RepID=A0A395H5D3_9EURO|nr:2-methylcitrate dehydratase PrpD [Aspergillus ibericus CBS 121593]RAL03091.1 2-methylcitrate dehydratase PrpD [Aspergillus ibericus CBS 121593]